MEAGHLNGVQAEKQPAADSLPSLTSSFRWPCCRKRCESFGKSLHPGAIVLVKALFQYCLTDLALSRFCEEA